jgi:hypothetical protein
MDHIVFNIKDLLFYLEDHLECLVHQCKYRLVHVVLCLVVKWFSVECLVHHHPVFIRHNLYSSCNDPVCHQVRMDRL